jgi:RND family efflux transporter MFP subunit
MKVPALKAIVPVLALSLSAACGRGGPEHSAAAPQPVRVQVADVERVSDRRPIDVRGVVQPARQATVSSRATGPIVALRVRAGDTVRTDQILLEIQPEAADGQLAQAAGGLAQARSALALAERNFHRFEALSADKAASELELDMARMQYEQARGAVEQAEGAVQSASSIASESTVRAPFPARVVATMVEVGDLAAPGRPLVQLEGTGGQQIWLAVREGDIARLAPGDEVPVAIDARSDLGVLRGRVEEILPAADPATHTFTVKVGLGGARVPSGSAGRAVIAGDPSERLLVPAAAVHRRGGLELVVVRGPDGTARTRAVTTGAVHDDGRVEVLSGLDAGESVAVDAPGPVADGTPLETVR